MVRFNSYYELPFSVRLWDGDGHCGLLHLIFYKNSEKGEKCHMSAFGLWSHICFELPIVHGIIAYIVFRFVKRSVKNLIVLIVTMTNQKEQLNI